MSALTKSDTEVMSEAAFNEALRGGRRDFSGVIFSDPTEIIIPHGQQFAVESLDFSEAVFRSDFALGDLVVADYLCFSHCVGWGRVQLYRITAGAIIAEQMAMTRRFAVQHTTADTLSLRGSGFTNGLFCQGLTTHELTDLSEMQVTELLKIVASELTRLNTTGTTLPVHWDDSWFADTVVRAALRGQSGSNTLVW